MTVQETIDEVGNENYDAIFFEEGAKFEDSVEIDEHLVDFANTEAIDSVVLNDDRRELHILVQQERDIKYVHIGAPAPQYAINSISRIKSAILHASSALGIYAREEGPRSGAYLDVILEPDTTDEQVATMFADAAKYLADDGHDGAEATAFSLSYDAGTAMLETDRTRNW